MPPQLYNRQDRHFESYSKQSSNHSAPGYVAPPSHFWTVMCEIFRPDFSDTCCAIARRASPSTCSSWATGRHLRRNGLRPLIGRPSVASLLLGSGGFSAVNSCLGQIRESESFQRCLAEPTPS